MSVPWSIASDKVTADDLLPYLQGGQMPQCPSGGTYTFESLTEVPTCSVSGHALPSSIGSPAQEQAMGNVIEAVEKDLNRRLTSSELSEARTAYDADHGGSDASTSMGQYILYLKQPGPQFQMALGTYKQTHNGQMPTNVVELAPYFQ